MMFCRPPVFALCAFTLLTTGALAADEYPTKPIRLAVGFAPGGSSDTSARAIARRMGDSLRVNFVVENRAGAGGNIAADTVAKAAPDGYTLFWGGVGPLTISPAMGTKLAYDPIKDFAPIGIAVTFCNVLVATPSLPAQTVPELLALARAKPGALNYASPGNGSAGHLGGELLKKLAKLDIVHVPYKGGSEMVTNLIGGEVQLAFVTVTTIKSFGGTRVKAIAVTSLKRDPTLPNVPSFAEAGVPGYDATFWYGLLAPARTPPTLVTRLNREMVAALADAEVNKPLEAQGLNAAPSTPEAFAKLIRSDLDKWRGVFAGAKIAQ
ncbi:MAG: tripartite tricarboxylate transporter substrate binding protein [Burkholderiales bacterium]